MDYSQQQQQPYHHQQLPPSQLLRQPYLHHGNVKPHQASTIPPQNHQQPQPKKKAPVGSSPSYIFAAETIKKFYQFSQAPNLIARTNHSTVHKVYSDMYQRDVAVKIIDKRAIPANLVDKFLPRELEITRIVNHPHLVRCLHIIQPNLTKVAIISEFYSGGTLLQYVIKQGIVDGPTSAKIFRQLVEAISYLHNLGICHRDIKMENILLDKNEDLKLADFGFARYINQAQASTSFCGTRPYSAPQLVQQRPYNPFAADWYAAGVVLYTILCGKWPHEPREKCVYPLKYPENFDDHDARNLIEHLMHPSEPHRAGYQEILESNWMQKHTGGKWILSDEMFVYEVETLQ